MDSSTASTSTATFPATELQPATTSTISVRSGENASSTKPEEVLMVGNNHALTTIKEKLTNDLIEKREVISITGMGGIGKTTLAKKVYEDVSIKSHFDIRGWVAVSQSYSSKDMLQGLLKSLDQAYVVSEGQSESFVLKDKVRKTLLGRRYLIVIDDIWSTDAWNDMQICFPNQSTGSRVLLTTRLAKVATHASSDGFQYSMPTLSEQESWDLFYEKVFEKESYTCDEFEKIGKDIVLKCKGLPLAIVVIAGVLSKVKRKVEEWQNIAEDVKATLLTSDKEQNCKEILFLSYKHLPPELKTCFLYLGVFPEDYEIPTTQLVRHWAALQFLEAEANRREEVAWQSLEELIDRNLVLVGKRGLRGRVKTCKIHDLILEMCLRLAKEKNILHAIDDEFQVGQSSREPKQENGCCWVSLQSIPKNYNRFCPFRIDDSSLHNCHSFLVTRRRFHVRPRFLSLDYNQFKLVIVLDLSQYVLPFLSSPSELDNLHQLRYLAVTVFEISKSLKITNFKNLQVFILDGLVYPHLLHLTISSTPELMHLYIRRGKLYFNDGEKNSLLEKLTTVSQLSALCCINKGFMMTIPNVKKLLVRCDEWNCKCSTHPIDLLNNLSHLHQLENLSFVGARILWEIPVPILNTIPQKLKKLTFMRTNMDWKIMTILGRLPNLEVLKLKVLAFVGSEWEQTEEGFQNLKVLALIRSAPPRWIDTDYSFPRLERLVLKRCYDLKTLPYNCLSTCPSLKLIDLERCTKAILTSAKRIQEDGDGELEVRASYIR